MIARWKPVHLGHAAVLEALVERAEQTSFVVYTARTCQLQ
jgi:nicotinamide mononucleotide adenylyltransferase